MEKRLPLFLILSVAIIWLYVWMFGPEAKPKPEGAPDGQVVAGDQDDDADAKAKVEGSGDDNPGGDNKPDGDKKTDGGKPVEDTTGDQGTGKKPKEDDPPKDGSAIAPSKNDGPREFISLGSVANGDDGTKENPFRFLVILDSRAGTIRRIELAERTEAGDFRYRELIKEGGYLGDLALSEVEAGLRVNVVGHGTPAWHAGLQAWDPNLKAKSEEETESKKDVIVAVDGQDLDQLRQSAELSALTPLERSKGNTLTAVEAFDIYLESTSPEDKLELTVLRGGEKKKLVATLSKRPLSIIRPEVETIKDDVKLLRDDEHQSSFSMTLGNWEKGKWKPLAEVAEDGMFTGNWTVPKSGDKRNDKEKPSVEFHYQADGFTVIKRFSLVPTPSDQISNSDYKSYHLEFDIEIKNTSSQTSSIAYLLRGPAGLPTEGWWYSNKIARGFGAAGARDVIWSSKSLGDNDFRLWGCPLIVKNTIKDKLLSNHFFTTNENEDGRQLTYTGGDAQYFSVLMQPSADSDAQEFVLAEGRAVTMGRVPEKHPGSIQAKRFNTTFELISESRQLKPDQSLHHEFIVFAGPKQPNLLAEYEMEEVVYYGWFGVVSRPLVWLLHQFYRVVGNYGIAIIMLTILVRCCMIPISRKAARNAQMMQVLAPEMKRIADKYKNDMEKRGKAQQDLFRKNNYNPFGGCLLMFLQLPVFIGLYRGLSVDIALRDKALIPGVDWCSNLAGPDRLFFWGDWMFWAAPDGWLGPYFNILPIITVVLFLVQQKMFTPPPTDEQQQMTHRMMSFMTLFIGFMFFKVPSGLCIYFITSSLWGIIERKLLPKPKLPENLRHLLDDGKKPQSKSAKKSKGLKEDRSADKKKRPKPENPDDSDASAKAASNESGAASEDSSEGELSDTDSASTDSNGHPKVERQFQKSNDGDSKKQEKRRQRRDRRRKGRDEVSD